MIKGAAPAFCISCVAESSHHFKVFSIITQILSKPQISFETSSEPVLAATFLQAE